MSNPWTRELRRYQKIELLGQGAFGDVWLVHDTQQERRLAIKLFRVEMNQSGYLDLFKREFELLAELNHAHLARVFNFGFSSEENQYFFTSEYCPGLPLLQALEGRSTDYFEECLVQILSALDYVHSQAVIHGDIKSGNILIEDRDGHPNAKLLDFGIASKQRQTTGSVVAGTLTHMAPELFRRSASVDHRSDLYSLGMACLRALTGSYPFAASQKEEIVAWHLHGTIPADIWKGVACPRYLMEIITKLLEKDPTDRFSGARSVLNYLNLATGRKYVGIEKGFSDHIPLHGPLIERDELLDFFKRRIGALLINRDLESPCAEPMVTVVSGAAGTGKTRLLEETKHFIEVKEIPVVDLTCDYEVPSWEAIREALEMGPSERSPGDGEGDGSFLRQTKEFLDRAYRKPFCLLLDDYHKADTMTRRVLDGLKDKSTATVFVLAATKNHQEGAVVLKPIGKEGVRRYAHLILGAVNDVDRLADLLTKYSGGIPLLMVEGMRYLAPLFYRGASLENLTIPRDIAELYRERLDRLSDHQREALHTAALLFRGATEEELSAVLDRPPDALVRDLHPSLKEDLMTVDAQGKYVITSQAFALSLIHSLPEEVKRRLHRNIARGLSVIQKTSLSERAYHLSKSGSEEEALNLYDGAIREFKEQNLHAAVIDSLKKALAIAQRGTPRWSELNLEAIASFVLMGNYREAEEYLEDYQKTVPDAGGWRINELKGRLDAKRRHYKTAHGYYLETLRELPEGDVASQIRVKNSLANVEYHLGNFNRARELYQETLVLEVSLSPGDLSVLSQNQLGLVLAADGDYESGISFYHSRMERIPTNRHGELLSVLNNLGYVLLRAGKFDRGILCLQQALEIAEFTDALYVLFSIMGNLSTALIKQGKYAECIPLLQKMVTYQEKVGSKRDRAFNYLRVGGIYLTLGMDEVAISCFAKGEALAEEIQEAGLGLWFRLMQAYREKEVGNLEKADEALIRIAEDSVRMGDAEIKNWALLGRAEVAESSGNHSHSWALLDEAAGSPQEPDMQVRRQLLRLRLRVRGGENLGLEESCSNLESECRKFQLRELLCEVYEFWSDCLERQGDRDRANAILKLAVDLLNEMIAGLPEELRGRYLEYRIHRKIWDRWKEASQKSPVHPSSEAAAFEIPSGPSESTSIQAITGQESPCK